MVATTSTAKILTDLTHLGIEMQADGDRLRFRPLSAMTPDLMERVRDHKAELLTILSEPSYADQEIERFLSICRPHEGGWHDPSAVTPELAAYQSTTRGMSFEQVIDLELASRQAPRHIEGVPAGWAADRWAARLRNLASSCAACHPSRATELRSRADAIDAGDGSPTREIQPDLDADGRTAVERATQWRDEWARIGNYPPGIKSANATRPSKPDGMKMSSTGVYPADWDNV